MIDWLQERDLEDWRKIAQIAFFLVTMCLAVQTYRKAKNGLLNSVNTEYQKRVMDRLKEISDRLYAEFDLDSDEHWVKNSNVACEIETINKTFERHKQELLQGGYWPFGAPVMPSIRRLSHILGSLESDPFVPKAIRDKVVSFLRDRLDVMQTVYTGAFEKYTTSLVKGKKQPAATLDERNKIHNDVVKQLIDRGCGIPAIEEEVHTLRKDIQTYFETFIPK